jgi:hypothetical protein
LPQQGPRRLAAMPRHVSASRGPAVGEYPGTQTVDAVAALSARRPSPLRQRRPPPPVQQQLLRQLHQGPEDESASQRERAEPRRSSAFATAATGRGAEGPEFPAIERARALFEQRQRERAKQLGEELASTMQRAVAAAAETVAGGVAKPASRPLAAPHHHPRGSSRERRPLHEPARALHAHRANDDDAELVQADRSEIERVLSAAVSRRVLDVFEAAEPSAPASEPEPLEEDPFAPFHYVERGLAAQVRRKVDALLAADRATRAAERAARA